MVISQQNSYKSHNVIRDGIPVAQRASLTYIYVSAEGTFNIRKKYSRSQHRLHSQSIIVFAFLVQKQTCGTDSIGIGHGIMSIAHSTSICISALLFIFFFILVLQSLRARNGLNIWVAFDLAFPSLTASFPGNTERGKQDLDGKRSCLLF